MTSHFVSINVCQLFVDVVRFQRKKDEGFGEGNFTALFKSIERDQIERGALQVKESAA